jgi:uncharacterized membrane protein
MISRITEGLSSTQVRTIRVRVLFLCVKALTDFLTAGGAAFTAAAIEARGVPTLMVLIVCFVGGVVVAAKNFGDALSAALPPPVIAALPPPVIAAPPPGSPPAPVA